MRSDLFALTVCLLTLTSCSSVAEARPQLELDGTGRVCAGHLSVTPKEITWKTPLASCSSPYKVLHHQGSDWTLELQSATGCTAFKSVTLRKTDPSDPQSFWNISGSASPPAGNNDAKPLPALSCLMY